MIEGVTTIINTIENNSPNLNHRIFSLVNEPRPSGNLSISDRPQVWADHLGEEYIDLSFMTAAPLVNPKTDVLMINNTDNIGLTQRSNSDLARLTRIRKTLEKQGVQARIGYGIQGTFDEKTNWEQFENNIKRFVDAGFEIYITEARVNKKSTGISDTEWQTKKAIILSTAFASALRAGASGFTMFYHDKGSNPGNSTLTPLTPMYKPSAVLYAIDNEFYKACQNYQNK